MPFEIKQTITVSFQQQPAGRVVGTLSCVDARYAYNTNTPYIRLGQGGAAMTRRGLVPDSG